MSSVWATGQRLATTKSAWSASDSLWSDSNIFFTLLCFEKWVTAALPTHLSACFPKTERRLTSRLPLEPVRADHRGESVPRGGHRGHDEPAPHVRVEALHSGDARVVLRLPSHLRGAIGTESLTLFPLQAQHSRDSRECDQQTRDASAKRRTSILAPSFSCTWCPPPSILPRWGGGERCRIGRTT